MKSWVPTKAAAQASSASRSTRCGHQSARPRSKGLGARVVGWWWSLVPALVGVLLQVAVLAAVAVALATRLTLAANLPVVSGVFVLGQLAGSGRGGEGLRAWLSYLVPDLVVFQFSDRVAEHISAGGRGVAVPAGVLLAAVGVALAYVAGALTVGSALFRRRDME